VLVVGLLCEDVEGQNKAGDGQAQETGDPVDRCLDDAVPDSGRQEPLYGESGNEKKKEAIGGFDDGVEVLVEVL